MNHQYWVVIPAYNEERLISTCLDSLATQTDQEFQIVVVDNSSTDSTRDIVERWFNSHPNVMGEMIGERQKGTGSAADTGFRHAIACGAEWVARTDADCIADPDWVAAIKRNTTRAQMLGGKTRARTDESPVRVGEMVYLPVVISGARAFGRLRPSNRGRAYRCPYVMCVGNNLAIESETYLASGGFPRLAIEDMSMPNDRALVNRVRRISSLVRYAPDMVVYNSVRRLRAYGLVGTLRWYANHSLSSSGLEVDIR